MPVQSGADKRFRSNIKTCKYCEKAAKINYYGIKRRHKGYLRTCGSDECLKKQYSDKIVNAKKSIKSKNLYPICEHCGNKFLKETNTHKWCRECVPDKAASGIMKRYGLSKREYLNMIEEVSGVCPICLKRSASVVDHCHKTKKVRGIICNHCNMALHLVEDELALNRALIYLSKIKT